MLTAPCLSSQILLPVDAQLLGQRPLRRLGSHLLPPVGGAWMFARFTVLLMDHVKGVHTPVLRQSNASTSSCTNMSRL